MQSGLRDGRPLCKENSLSGSLQSGLLGIQPCLPWYLSRGLENLRPQDKHSADQLPRGLPHQGHTSPQMCSLQTEHFAELNQAERSGALSREARPPPKAAGAVRRPRAARGPPSKARMRINCLRLSTWRLNSFGRRESVLCTNGILISIRSAVDLSSRKLWA